MKKILNYLAALILTLGYAAADVTLLSSDSAIGGGTYTAATLAGFDPAGADKIVVTIHDEGESATSVSYGGAPMNEAIEIGSGQYTAVYYLDVSGPITAGNLVVNGGSNGVSIFALSGTAPGFGAVASRIGSPPQVDLDALFDGSMVVAAFTANQNSAPYTSSANPPLTTVLGDANVGSSLGGSGWASADAGNVTYSFTGSASNGLTVAVAFPAAGADTIAPGITSVSPADESTDLLTDVGPLVINFDESIEPGTGSILLKKDGGATVASYDVTSAPELTFDVFSLAITPDVLEPSTSYYLEIPSGTIEDGSGNTTSYPDTILNFTTGPWLTLQLSGSSSYTVSDLRGFDATGYDKLVVTVMDEGGAYPSSVSYGAASMTPINNNNNGNRRTSMYYLDGPFTGPETLTINGIGTSFGASLLALSGTSPGVVKSTAVSLASTSFTTDNDNSFVVTGYTTNGGGTPATASGTGTTYFSADVGSADGAGGAYTTTTAGPTAYGFTGNTSAPSLVIAEFAPLILNTTITGTTGGNDSWNVSGNWDNGVPTGPISAVVGTGVTAKVENAATPTYSGGLTIGDGSHLQLGWVGGTAGTVNALGTGDITMNDGSSMDLRVGGNVTFGQDIILAGNAQIHHGTSGGSHHDQRTYNGAITGAHVLTMIGNNNQTINLNQTNSFSEFIGNAADRWRINANAAGALGTGNVTINGRGDGRSAELTIGAADAIADTATLTLDGGGFSGNGTNLIIMNANDTVNELFIAGSQAFAGTYTSASGDWISGSGTLTVLNGPVDVPPTLASSDIVDEFFAAGTPNAGYDNIWQDFTVVNYAVTFNEDMDETTVNPGDFENGGTATGWSIGAVTKTVSPANPLSPSTFNVEVILTAPSTGTLQLQVKQGADLKDSTGMSLDTATAIPDDTTITINAGPSPLATITGTAGGSDSWNDPSNWDNAGGIGQRVPFGPGSALVDAGLLTQITNPAPSYTGSLELASGSTLQIRHLNALGVVQTPSGITVNDGATLDVLDGSPDFGAIALSGSTRFTWRGNGAHHETADFDGVISGSGSLFINGVNNDTFNLNASNTFGGGFSTSSDANQGFRVNATANGALGTGDVLIGNDATLEISSGLGDVIGDGAALDLVGREDSRRASKLILNSDETVGAFFIEGVKQPGGTYGRIGSGAGTETALITGNGILTVPVEVLSIARNGDNPNNGPDVSWVVTFDGSVSGLTTANFTLSETGTVSGSLVTGVTGMGNSHIVTASIAGGCGTLDLNLQNDSGTSPPISNLPYSEPLGAAAYDIDTEPPVISCAKQIVVTVEEGSSATVSYAPTAWDECEGASVPVVCDPASPGTFAIGNHVVECTATDSAGNVGTASFNVVVLVQQPVNGERFLEGISVRGDEVAAGTGIAPDAVILSIGSAFLNDGGDVVFDANLQGNGANSSAVFFRPDGGSPAPVAVKGNSFGAGSYGIFSNLSLNDGGGIGFQSLTSGNLPGHFAGPGAGPVANSALRLGAAPTGVAGEVYNGLYQPALASNGELLTPAALLLGGGGVSSTSDTLITSSAGTVLAREGSATGTGDLTHGQFLARVVASDEDGHYAFPSLVFGSTPAGGNAGIFVGQLGGGSPSIAVRKGDAAADTPGGTFGSFLGESVNSSGEIALRAFAFGGGVTASDNEGIWTNSGNASAPPVLVAREGDVTPCIGEGLIAFGSFKTVYMGDDGSVCFLAYLRDATTTPAVFPSNDASIWLWRNGVLDLIVREGDIANSTDSCTIARLVDFDSNGDIDGGNGIVYSVDFVPGIGDASSRTNQAVYVDRGGEDLAPVLVLRRGDSFDDGEDESDILSLRISTATSPSGSTGGLGRAINGDGDVLLNVGFTGSRSGIFVLSSPPVLAAQ